MTTSHLLTACIALLIGALVAWALTRASFSARLARSRAEVTHLRAHAQEVIHAQDRLTDAFESLSTQALERTSDRFLQLAEQRFQQAQAISAAELAKREHAVQSLVEPLNEALTGIRNHLSTVERDRAQAHGSLIAHIGSITTSSQQLREEASQLAQALSASHIRGRWGEMHLRRVVEAAGMMEHVDFNEQVTLETVEGRQRPDMVIHLPGEKHVIVDAKASLNAFLTAQEETNQTKREELLKKHTRHVREHIDDLASKAYWQSLDATPEFVVMFLPTDAMLASALHADPHLLDEAFTRHVVVATPSTLVAILRTIAFTWRQDRLADQAHAVFNTGRELHRRLGIFGRHLNELAKRLNSSVEAFNSLNRSLDATLVPQVKRFAELQGFDDPIATPDPIESHAVPAAKPELHLSPGDEDQGQDKAH